MVGLLCRVILIRFIYFSKFEYHWLKNVPVLTFNTRLLLWLFVKFQHVTVPGWMILFASKFSVTLPWSFIIQVSISSWQVFILFLNLYRYNNVNINVAVQTDNGLFVPVIRVTSGIRFFNFLSTVLFIHSFIITIIFSKPFPIKMGWMWGRTLHWRLCTNLHIVLWPTASTCHQHSELYMKFLAKEIMDKIVTCHKTH